MWRLAVFALIAAASAQIPSFGWCPDYQPMANFNMNRFLGTWYEAERYFTVSELGSRCVTTKYESTPEGRILVSNEITNSLTGMKRVMDGHLQTIGREGEGKIVVKYSSLPVPYENVYSILDTDYNNYAVMWSCSGIGPVHTQNAWVLTRERLAPTAVMQSAYGVLDKFRVSRTFFVRTNQGDCNVLPNPAANPTEATNPNVENVEKHAGVVPDAVENQSVGKKADPEAKSIIPQHRVADSKSAEEAKPPLQVPELIISESTDKVEVKMDKIEQTKQAKGEKSKSSESNQSKEKKPEANPSQ